MTKPLLAGRLASLCACGLLLAISGCRLIAPRQSSDCSVRLIDAIPDAGGVRVSVDGKKVFNDCLYRTGTGFESIPPVNTMSTRLSSGRMATISTCRSQQSMSNATTDIPRSH